MRTLLAPFSWLYGFGLAIRHTLYDNHLLPSHEVDIPTICVGNLAVGGTGKTPHVEYLIRLLSPMYKVAVLSRGYKRKTHGFVLADENANVIKLDHNQSKVTDSFKKVALDVTVETHGHEHVQRIIKALENAGFVIDKIY